MERRDSNEYFYFYFYWRSQGEVLSQMRSLSRYSFSPIPFQGLSLYTHLLFESLPGSFVKTRPSGPW